MLRIASAMRWLLLALFAGIVLPVVADFIEKQLERSGAYEHPSYALRWIENHLSAFFQMSWVFPTTLILGGLTTGVWLDWLLRKLDSTRAENRINVGYAFLRWADAIHDRQQPLAYLPWPQSINDIMPDVMAALLHGKAIGLWVPDRTIFQDTNGATILPTYFRVVGTFLKERHFKEAKQSALDVKAELARYRSSQ
jgi:hypothetical protein